MIYFTSDFHFHHTNIIQYCNRGFVNAKEMNGYLVREYNARIGSKDHVYILGDIGFGRDRNIENLAQVTNKLNGYKHLILGNHDEYDPYTYHHRLGFDSVHTWLKLDGFPIVMVHDPAMVLKLEPMMEEMGKYNNIYLVGHAHHLFKCLPEKRIINVGIDVWDFKPVHINEILDLARTFPCKTDKGCIDASLPDQEAPLQSRN